MESWESFSVVIARIDADFGMLRREEVVRLIG
jgi:hypothetical protein